MTAVQFINNLSILLTKITTHLLAVPTKSAVVIRETNTTGMQLLAGMPMALFNLATTVDEATTLQSGADDFLDVRDSTYWTKQSGSWVANAYTGNKPFLRVYSFVTGRNNGKTYFFADGFAFYLANTTTPTT